jgi:hypothetical protein
LDATYPIQYQQLMLTLGLQTLDLLLWHYTSREFELLNVGEPLIQISPGFSPVERLKFHVVFTSSLKWKVNKASLYPPGHDLCEQGPR